MQLSENSEVQVGNMSSIKSIGNIFFEPTKVFRNFGERPKNLIAIILLIVFSLLISIPQIPYIENAARNNTSKMFNNERFMKTTPGLTEEMVDKQIEMSVTFTKVFTFISPLVILIALLFQSLIFLGLFKMFKGKGNFRQTFSVFLYSYFIVLIGWTTKMVSVITTGNIEAGNSFGILMQNDKTNFLYNLISNIDFFYVWSLFVTAVGLAIVHKVSNKKSIYIVFGTWVVIILLYAATTTFQAISMYEKFGITL